MTRFGVLLLVGLVCLVGCSGPAPAPTSPVVGFAPPPAHAAWDYQIGGAYPPPAAVRVVTRDRTSKPAANVYNICYINGYQTQPQEIGWWQANHPDLLLTGADGRPVEDQQWHELLLDIHAPAKRSAIAAIVNGWIDGCRDSHFNAIEPDNLDSWTRSNGLLTQSDALAFAALIIARAHADGLAIGQKNAAEIAARGRAAGFDFAVAEQCADYHECGSYQAAYGAEVLVVEYSADGLRSACAGWRDQLSIVRRDQDVQPAGNADYVFQTC